MPFFGLVWTTSWVSCLLASTQGLFKVPDYLGSALPEKVFSVVSSPRENSMSRFVPPLASGVGYHNSLAIALLTPAEPDVLLNLALPTALSTFPLSSQPTQISWRFQLPPDQPEQAFCSPESPAKKESPTLGETSTAAWQEKSTDNVSKANLPQQILRVVQNLFSWRQRVEPEAKVSTESTESVVVISTHREERISEPKPSKERQVKSGLWRYSQLLKNALETAPPSTKDEEFKILAQGTVIAQLPNRQQAEQIAQSLKKLFCQSNFKSLSVEATIVDGTPAIKAGDVILFRLDKDLTKNLAKHPELLVIEWANNLRISLGQSPLQITEAQQRMYNVLETANKIEGLASWYGHYFNGRLTANGEIYNENELTAAHPSLPFDTYLRVKNLKNGNSVIVRINDRGPYIPGRTLDLSRQAARSINSEQVGVIPFEATIMKPSRPNSVKK